MRCVSSVSFSSPSLLSSSLSGEVSEQISVSPGHASCVAQWCNSTRIDSLPLSLTFLSLQREGARESSRISESNWESSKPDNFYFSRSPFLMRGRSSPSTHVSSWTWLFSTFSSFTKQCLWSIFEMNRRDGENTKLRPENYFLICLHIRFHTQQY